MSWIVAAVVGGSALVGGVMQSKAAGEAVDAQTAAAQLATGTELSMFERSREDVAPWRIAGENALTMLMGGDTYGLAKPSRDDYWTTPAQPPGGQPRATKYQGRDAYESGLNDVNAIAQAPQVFDQESYDKDYQNYLDSKTTTEGLIQKGPGEFIPEEDPGYEFGYQESVEKPLLRGAAATGRLGDGRTMKELTRYASDYASTKYDNFLSRYYDSLKPLQSMAGIGQTTAAQSSQNALVTGQNIAQRQVGAGEARASGYIDQGNVWGGAVSGLGQNALDYYYMNKFGSTPQTPQINYGGR